MQQFPYIAENLCTQLIALQNSIATRVENPNLPTPQEVALQSKLISCIIKLTKPSAKTKASPSPVTQTAAQPAVTQAAKTGSTPQIIGDPPPFNQEIFELEKGRLVNYESGDSHAKVNFMGKKVNKRWLDYNLLQYYLPEENRIFIASETRYTTTMPHAETKKTIKLLLEYLKTQAA